MLVRDFSNVHYFEHSSYNPWFLISVGNFHRLHHRISNHDLGFGLTCTFWDYIFGTLPPNSNFGNFDIWVFFDE